VESNRLSERLRALPRRERVAFAAFCVERVIPIFKTVLNERDQNQPDAAVACAWRFVEGHAVFKEDVLRLEDEVGAVLAFMNTSPLTLDAAKDVCSGAIYLLDSIIDETEAKSTAHAVRVVGFSGEAVDLYEDYEGPGSADEQDMQERALKLVESLPPGAVSRASFEELRAIRPAWLEVRNQ
jgi:hypothetical protein